MDKIAASEIMPRIYDAAADVAGGVVGGLAAGAHMDIVLAGAVGPVLASLLKYIGTEFSSRYLSPREAFRVASVASRMVEKTKIRLAAGDSIRNDDFFDKQYDDRSPADEIGEAIFLVAQREPEEKKIELLASILTNISFDATVSRAQANFIVALASRLTYRQFCFISIFSKPELYSLRNSDYRAETGLFSWGLISALSEVFELVPAYLNNKQSSAYLGVTDINPADTKLQGLGITIHRLADLESMVDVMLPDLHEAAMWLT